MRGIFRIGDLLLIIGLAVSPSLSDTKPEPRAPRTRIGLINLKEVFKGYRKAAAGAVPKNQEQTVSIYKDIATVVERYARAHDLDLVMHYKGEPVTSPDYFKAANISGRIQIGPTLPMFIGPKLEITKEIIAELNKKRGDVQEEPVPEAVKARPRPRTRVALVNLAQVFKGYEKVAAFSAANKKLLEPYAQRAKMIQLQIEAHTDALKVEDLTLEQRSQYLINRILWQGELECANEAIKLIKADCSQKNEELMLKVYKEAMAAVQRHAKGHEIDLVMHYNGVLEDQPEVWNPASVKRSLSAGACIPLYIAPELEITKQIISDLNERYHREKGLS